MKEIKIYLCRHGETPWSLSGQHTGKTDLSLTPTGEKQAIQLKTRLQKFHFDHVLCSPLKRAIETCTLAGFKPEINPDLQEWNYGDYEGITKKEIRKTNPEWNIFDCGAPHGESPEQISQRADRVIQSCEKLNGSIVLFSHGHFLRVLATRWIGLPVEQGKLFSLSVASISLLTREGNQKVIALWNETAT